MPNQFEFTEHNYKKKIKIARSYDQLHILTNHPNIYESYRTNYLIEVAFTKRR